MIARWVKALRASAVGPGMMVGIECEDRIPHLALIQACEIVGATSFSLSHADVASGARIMGRCDFLCLRHVPDAMRDRGLLELSAATLDRVAALPLAPADLRVLDHCPADGTVIRLTATSGSSGEPKIVPQTQGTTRRLRERSMWFPDDPGFAWNFLNVYNFTIRGAQRETETALCLGRTAVMSALDGLLDDMTRFGQCRLTLIAGDAVRLAEGPGWSSPRTAVLHVKGGHLPLAVRARITQRIVTHLFHSYGTKETQIAAMIGADGIAVVVPEVTIRLVDGAGQPVPFGEVGVIEIQTDAVPKAYFDDEAQSEAAFHDGWYRSPDLGRMVGPDRFELIGRADDMVNLGGIKVAPHGLEDRIRALDGVRDAVLVAVPARDGPDEAHVVLEGEPSLLTPAMRDALADILRGALSQVVATVLADLPRTDTGKVRRQALREQLAAMGAASG